MDCYQPLIKEVSNYGVQPCSDIVKLPDHKQLVTTLL